MNRDKSGYIIITLLSLAVMVAMFFVTPGKASSQPSSDQGWISFAGSDPGTNAKMILLRGNASEIDLSAVAPGVRTASIMQGSDVYTRFTADGFGVGSAYGQPDLPVLRQQVEIPFGASYTLDLTYANVSESSMNALQLAGQIYPLQPPDCKCDDAPPAFTKDEEAYSQDAYVPAQPVIIRGETIQRGHRILTVEFSPVAYNPVTGGLQFYTEVAFRIHLTGADMALTHTRANHYRSPAFEKSLSRQVFNFNQGQETNSIAESGPVGYLIISADAYYAHMAPFVDLKQSEGFTVVHTPLSAIGSTATQIKAYIQEAYDTWTLPPSYVLLVGDTNTLPTWTGPEIGTSTDLYYATLEGTDWNPDIGRGRFPVRSTAQVEIMVNKYLAFADLSGDEAWVKKAAFPATCDQYQVAEGTHNYVINSYMIDHGYTGTFPNNPQPGGDKLYCVTYDAIQQDVLNSLNDGRAMLIYSGHGSYDGWELFSQSAIQNTAPGYYPFVASHACLTGDYGQTEVFGETWVLANNKGGLAYWGSSTYTYWDEDDILERGMFDSLFNDTSYQPDYTGMTYDGLWAMQNAYPGMAQYYWETYNILGDPSAAIILEARHADLDLAVEPAELEICAAGIISTTVTADSMRGVGMVANLSTFNMPSGISSDFDPDAVVLPGESILSLTLDGTTQVGDYTLGIQGVIPGEYTTTVSVPLSVFDAIPVIPELLYPAPEATNVGIRPTFSWSSLQGQTYEIQIALDSTFTQMVDSATGLTALVYTPSIDLANNTVYYWRVNAHNTCGSSTWSTPARFLTETTLGQCTLGRTPVVHLSEDFEGLFLPTGWDSDGVGPTWASSLTRKHSGNRSIKGVDVNIISDQWLITPVMVLPVENSPLTVSFWNYRKLQTPGCADGGVVEITTDGGTSWTSLASQLRTDLYNGVIDSNSNPLVGQAAWCGAVTTWMNAFANLDEFAGETVQLRFRLGTDDNIGHEGWYVDDLVLQSCTPSTDFQADTALIAAPGQPVTFTFTLNNQGTQDDSFMLMLDPGIWPATLLSSTPVTVTAGTSVNLQVRVEVPAGVAGETDNFGLHAISQTIPGIMLHVTGTVHVSEDVGFSNYLPLVGR